MGRTIHLSPLESIILLARAAGFDGAVDCEPIGHTQGYVVTAYKANGGAAASATGRDMTDLCNKFYARVAGYLT